MKKIIWLILIIAVAVLIWWMVSSRQAAAPTTDEITETSTQQSADGSISTSGTLDAELQGLGETDINAEFQAIDGDINQL